MKKLLMLLSFILLISSFSIIGYVFVEAKQEITKEPDVLKLQVKKDEYITPYGYTIEEPNIILDPYDISPLTALILFETEKEEEITVIIKGHDEKSTIINTFNKSLKHYIPIYGLYPNEENEIILKTKNKTITHKITTSPIPITIETESVITTDNTFTFFNKNNHLYALDSNNDIRWYLKGDYKYNVIKLENGHFLIPTTELNNSFYPIGVVEIDLLGKIYKQYNIENGYYGNTLEVENYYYILSKNLLQIDKQTGYLINQYKLKDNYTNLTYSKENKTINLNNTTKNLSINLKTNEKVTTTTEFEYSKQEVDSPLYHNNDSYKLTKPTLFDMTIETKESKDKIFLVNSKKIDKNYKKYNVKLTQNNNYLKITGNFNGSKVHLILDKFVDKKIYDINNNYTIINYKNLNGKYNIYLKIDDKIYKTNKFIEIKN